MATAFQAYLSSSASSVTGDGTIYPVAWDAVRFDIDNELNTANGVFTATVNGIYRFSTVIFMTPTASNQTTANVQLITSSQPYMLWEGNPYEQAERQSGNNSVGIGGSVLVEMAANDTAYIRVQVIGGSKSVAVAGLGFSNFSGELVQ